MPATAPGIARNGPSARAARALWTFGRTVPFPCWRWASGVSLVVPYYHVVSDADVPHARHLYSYRDIRTFAADIEFLLAHFVPVELQDIIDVVDGKRQFRRPVFHVTFDDGFREIHDVVAPMLRRRGVPATFFLNTGFLDQQAMAHHNAISLILDRIGPHPSAAIRQRIERLLGPAAGLPGDLATQLRSIRYADRAKVDELAAAVDVDLAGYLREARPFLSSEQVRALLDQGFAIGAHSHDHPLYADLRLDEQVAQTKTSLELLGARFGVRRNVFAFPHTDTGVKADFFDAMFSTKTLDLSFGTGGLIPHFHPRNIERVGMEHGLVPADRILSRQLARAVYRRF